MRACEIQFDKSREHARLVENLSAHLRPVGRFEKHERPAQTTRVIRVCVREICGFKCRHSEYSSTPYFPIINVYLALARAGLLSKISVPTGKYANPPAVLTSTCDRIRATVRQNMRKYSAPLVKGRWERREREKKREKWPSARINSMWIARARGDDDECDRQRATIRETAGQNVFATHCNWLSCRMQNDVKNSWDETEKKEV